MDMKALGQLRYLRREIKKLKQKKVRILDRATDTSVKITGLPSSSGKSDKVSHGGTRLAAIQRLIEERQRQAEEEELRLTAYINSVEDSRMRQVLDMHFVEGLSWTAVAMRLGGGNTGDGVRMAVKRFLENR